MQSIMERLWLALESISHDFDYPPDPESLQTLENSLLEAGLMIVDINDAVPESPASDITQGALSQAG